MGCHCQINWLDWHQQCDVKCDVREEQCDVKCDVREEQCDVKHHVMLNFLTIFGF